MIQRRRHLTTDSLELLFPYFFGLAPEPAGGPGRVLLPRTELVGRAGHWSWREEGRAIIVTAVTASEGFQLVAHAQATTWNGQLHAWSAEQAADWLVAGARVPCPDGLVPAAE